MTGKLRKIEIDNSGDESIDITYYFEDSSRPFSIYEFKPGSPTRKALDEIENSITDYNSECDL